MRKLDIRSTLGDDAFLAIALCLRNLETLHIKDVGDKITMKGILALAEAIKNRKDKVNISEISEM